MSEQEKIVGYQLSRPDAGGNWVYAGNTPEQVAETLRVELRADIDSGLPADESGCLVVEPYLTTQAEIDELPEFEGW